MEKSVAWKNSEVHVVEEVVMEGGGSFNNSGKGYVEIMLDEEDMGYSEEEPKHDEWGMYQPEYGFEFDGQEEEKSGNPLNEMND